MLTFFFSLSLLLWVDIWSKGVSEQISATNEKNKIKFKRPNAKTYNLCMSNTLISDSNLSYPKCIYQDILCCLSSAVLLLHFSLLYLSSFNLDFLRYFLAFQKSHIQKVETHYTSQENFFLIIKYFPIQVFRLNQHRFLFGKCHLSVLCLCRIHKRQSELWKVPLSQSVYVWKSHDVPK